MELVSNPFGWGTACPHRVGSRRTEKIPLPQLDPEATDHLVFFLPLDAFGYHLRADPLSQLENGAHNFLFDQAFLDVLDERMVNLQELGTHLGDGLEAGVSCSHVVDGQLKSQSPDLLQAATEAVEI